MVRMRGGSREERSGVEWSGMKCSGMDYWVRMRMMRMRMKMVMVIIIT
jgi:hypothetical protein